jgi:three-Cys-motif partner protein
MSELDGASPTPKVVIGNAANAAPLNFHALWGGTDQAPAARAKQNSERYSMGDDGLLVENVGPWVKDKHEYVTKIVHASGAARRKFRNSAFIEVFSGPGRALIRDNGEYVDGSAVRAFKARLGSLGAFGTIEISDARHDLRDAARQRLARLGAPVRTAVGPAKNAIKEIVGRLDSYGLHFAFFDPHNLGTLSFSLFEEIAKLKCVDVLAHVSIADMQRNSDRYESEDYGQFDEMSPDWRKRVRTDMSKHAFRSAFLNDWSDQIEKLGLPRAKHYELVKGTHSQRLYWLIFLSRHPLPHRLWTSISSDARAPTFGF